MPKKTLSVTYHCSRCRKFAAKNFSQIQNQVYPPYIRALVHPINVATTNCPICGRIANLAFVKESGYCRQCEEEALLVNLMIAPVRITSPTEKLLR